VNIYISEDWRNKHLKVTTEKDETGAIRVAKVESNRNKNTYYNEEDNNLKGDVSNE